MSRAGRYGAAFVLAGSLWYLTFGMLTGSIAFGGFITAVGAAQAFWARRRRTV